MASAAHEAFSALNCTNLLQHLSCLCCKAYPMILMLHMSRHIQGVMVVADYAACS